MTAVGFVLWMTAVFIFLSHLTREERRRVEECEGLLLMLRHLRARVSAYSLPRDEIYRTFSHLALEKCGFLLLLREKGLKTALSSKTLALDGEMLRPLVLFAEGEGERLKEEELSAVSLAIEETEACLADAKRRLPERLRLSRTLVLTGGMMVAIFLL